MADSRKGIVLFGELMIRLNAMNFERLIQAEELRVFYTGAEANVGASLANWGYEAIVVSRVPAHEIGQACVNYLRRFGIDTRHIQRAGDRLGILYVETGASQRPSKVIYDRKGSAFTEFDDSQIDWDALFKGKRWFHFAGTAPAVSERLVPILERACAAAKRQAVSVSCDLNYRRKLWSQKQAQETMTRLMEFVDVLICNEEDAAMVFSIHAKDTDITLGTLSRDGYHDVASQLVARFGFSHVAITLRESLSASINNWGALLHHDGRSFFSRTYKMHVVDRIGGGDSFAAGLIYGLCEGMTAQDTVEFAVAASCLKHSIPGDFNLVSLEEVRSLLAGGGSGRIQR